MASVYGEAQILFARECEFMRGVADLHQLPDLPFPEVAFWGRSNVGKSSLVNALTDRRTLAKVSNTPGRTRELNFFLPDKRLVMVDLPGYGFAKINKGVAENWQVLTRKYLAGRQQLRRVYLLIDSRHGIKEVDTEMMEMLDETAVSYRIVMTKIDKPNGAELAEAQEKTLAAIKKHPAALPELLLTSAEKKEHIDALRVDIFETAFA